MEKTNFCVKFIMKLAFSELQVLLVHYQNTYHMCLNFATVFDNVVTKKLLNYFFVWFKQSYYLLSPDIKIFSIPQTLE